LTWLLSMGARQITCGAERDKFVSFSMMGGL
jgi:hypothetical protein